MIAVAALGRTESRGGHYRTDHSEMLPSAVPSSLSLRAALEAAREIAETKTFPETRTFPETKTSLRLVRS
jgi:hypothetical protein